MATADTPATFETLKQLTIAMRLEEGSMWATIKELPGVFATGDTLEELRASLEEGISLYASTPDKPAPRIRLSPLSPAETHTHTELLCV